MLKRIAVICTIIIGMFSVIGCVSTEDESRDYRPKGDVQMKEDMSSEQLMSYNLGMDDTKKFLESNDNTMLNTDVYDNLLENLTDKSIEFKIDPMAYFKGVAYYLVLVDSEGNEYKDMEAAQYLADNYELYVKNKIKNMENQKEEPKKEEVKEPVKKETTQRTISDVEVEEQFRHAIAKAYVDISDAVELMIYDEQVQEGVIQADALYNDELIARMYLNIYTGELTMDRFDQFNY